ncbi:MAG: hypothetical protein IKB90_02480 [Alistipes sp.]|nr:hypothetical protein [Alistipes sp.]
MNAFKFICIFVLIFITPIVVNYILGFKTPFNLEVFGSIDAWVAFYGAYFGGIITAAIGFITIHRQEKLNNKKILISHQETLIRDLENRLAECISIFDFSRVGIISLYFDDKSKYNDVLKEMDDYYHKLVISSNAWNTIYGEKTDDPYINSFQKAYQKCVNELVNALKDVTTQINILKDTSDIEKIAIVKSGIIKVITQSSSYRSNCIVPLQNNAQKWLNAERQKLKDIKNI